MITEEEVNKAYGDLLTETENYANISLKYAQAKADLEKERSAALMAKIIEGKNAEMREASAREVLRSYYEEKEALEQRLEQTQYYLNIARIEIERIRLLVRLMELGENTNE